MEDQIMGAINDQGGKVEQDQLVESFSDTASEREVLDGVRGLMEDSKVAYSHDWQLMSREW